MDDPEALTAIISGLAPEDASLLTTGALATEALRGFGAGVVCAVDTAGRLLVLASRYSPAVRPGAGAIEDTAGAHCKNP